MNTDTEQRPIKSGYAIGLMLAELCSRIDWWQDRTIAAQVDALIVYDMTMQKPSNCDTNEAAAQAWAWICGEESPLSAYERPFSRG